MRVSRLLIVLGVAAIIALSVISIGHIIASSGSQSPTQAREVKVIQISENEFLIEPPGYRVHVTYVGSGSSSS